MKSRPVKSITIQSFFFQHPVSLSVALRSAFATVVSADKRSYRGAASANLPITATGRASAPVGLNTSRSAAPSKPMAKHQTRASGKRRKELKKGWQERRVILLSHPRCSSLFSFLRLSCGQLGGSHHVAPGQGGQRDVGHAADHAGGAGGPHF